MSLVLIELYAKIEMKRELISKQKKNRSARSVNVVEWNVPDIFLYFVTGACIELDLMAQIVWLFTAHVVRKNDQKQKEGSQTFKSQLKNRFRHENKTPKTKQSKPSQKQKHTHTPMECRQY